MPDNPLDVLSTPKNSGDILSGLSVNSGYEGMDKAMQGLSKLPGLTDTILPSIKQLLMPGDNNPAFKAIDAETSANVAADQTDAMRRGLTGSDIEAASMTGARSAGEMAKSNFQAQTATQMSSFIKDLATGDFNAQRENLMNFAQMMGQKITSDNDLMMFRQMLQANMDQSEKNRKSALWGAGISAVGQIAGAGIKFSDERLKTDIRRIGLVRGIPVYAFHWKESAQAMLGAHDNVEVGVLAQDVEASYPDAVSEVQGWKAVDYSRLPSALVEEVHLLGASNA